MVDYEMAKKCAEELNQLIPKDHPCQAGNGTCCQQIDVPVAPFEQQEIVEAFEVGLLDPAVKQQALLNVIDPNNEYCPFFLKAERLCGIRGFHPLLCESFGAAAIVKPAHEGDFQQAVTDQCAKKVTVTLPQKQTKQFDMCFDCSDWATQSGYESPIEAVVKRRQIDEYYQQQSGVLAMNQFILRFLWPRIPPPS